jgi:hypothetical protein
VTSRRRLTLTRERLAELSADDLASVNGAQPQCTGTSHPFPTRDVRCLVTSASPNCPVLA